jgi:hypothetical protein
VKRKEKKRRKTNDQARNPITIRPEEEPIGREGNKRDLKVGKESGRENGREEGSGSRNTFNRFPRVVNYPFKPFEISFHPDTSDLRISPWLGAIESWLTASSIFYASPLAVKVSALPIRAP